ncbi:MAG: lysophospholipid acyltransferase family protein [Verrucomicrobiales bacterium]
MGKGSEGRESRKSTLLGRLAGWLMRGWCATLRLEVIDRSGGALESVGPVLFALWHNRIFVVPAAWRRLTRGKRETVVLTSASHDGAMLARAVGVFGIGSVRGSSSRRGVAALVALRKAVKEGKDCCLTPDGPRGPRYVLQPGLIKLAETSGAPILPIHVELSSAWSLRSWDRFQLPKPFSRVTVIFDEVLAVPSGLSEDAFAHWRSRVETVLRDGVDDISEQS